MIKAEELPSHQQNIPDSDQKYDKFKRMIDVNLSFPNETNPSLELISLRDVILDKNPVIDRQEPYFKLPDELNEDENSTQTALVLKRTRLLFNGKRCVALNFQDITAFQRLKKEEENKTLMQTLYSSVHHEMIGPLKNNVILIEQLMKLLEHTNQKRLAQLIMFSSK